MDRKQVLEDTIDYYSEDVNRRCKKSNSSQCYYSPKTIGKEGISEGCAVGRLLSDKLKEEIDENYPDGQSVSGIFNELPSEIQSLGEDFLMSLQRLHDTNRFWTEKGLSELGKQEVLIIKQEYDLL